MSDRLKEQALEAGYGNGIGSQLLARIDELEAINQALTASCDDTWHCACIVPLQKRITELEAELATTKLELAVAKDSADKWFTKCRTAEAELAKGNDALHENRELRMTIERLRECLKAAIIVIENAISAYPSPSASKTLEELRKALKEGK